MAPERIRLIDLKEQNVDWHPVARIPWGKVWTISHIWDWGDEPTKIPLDGITWESNSFSTILRFNLMFEKTREIVRQHNGEYIWIDAACIDQSQGEEQKRERNEQIPFMGTIYGMSAGSVAFGKQTPKDGFAEIASTYEGGRKAWVCDWFERVWTFQELQLPKKLFFVSGERTLTRDEVYLSILMISPYLTTPHPSPPSHHNDTHVSIQDVVNALSPSSKSNTQRSLMQTSKRGCSLDYINDKVFGILGVLPEPLKKMEVDYKPSLAQTVLNLMKLMPSDDVLDTLTFNKLPPLENIHDTHHWSGMIRLDGSPTEHPSYETDISPPETNALVTVSGNPPLATTIVYNALLWDVVVTKPENTHAASADTHVRAWPSIASLSMFARLTDDFSDVEQSADYVHAVGRAERSLAANWNLLKPLLQTGVSDGIGGEELLSILQNPPTMTEPDSIPPNRLGDPKRFDQEVTVLLCRSKKDKSFHYGIVVELNEDGLTWHKVCTAAFSNICIVTKKRVEKYVVIGK